MANIPTGKRVPLTPAREQEILALAKQRWSLERISMHTHVAYDKVKGVMAAHNLPVFSRASRPVYNADRIREAELTDAPVEEIVAKMDIPLWDVCEALAHLGTLDFGSKLRAMFAACPRLKPVAEQLGVHPDTLRARCRKYGISVSDETKGTSVVLTDAIITVVKRMLIDCATYEIILEKNPGLSRHQLTVIVSEHMTNDEVEARKKNMRRSGHNRRNGGQHAIQREHLRKSEQKITEVVQTMRHIPVDPTMFRKDQQAMLADYIRRGGQVTVCPQAVNIGITGGVTLMPEDAKLHEQIARIRDTQPAERLARYREHGTLAARKMGSFHKKTAS